MVGFAALQAVSELEANTQNPVRFHVKKSLGKTKKPLVMHFFTS